jgi:hypothetical protein
MATATHQTQARPRAWRLQFSLRLLLVTMLAFAVGFPIWYRWPYEEVEVQGKPPDAVTRTTTWQRQWGGGRLRHGPEAWSYVPFGSAITNYENGIKEGPYLELRDGQVVASGRYRDGQRDGVWKRLGGPFSPHHTVNWQDGKLDGPYETQFSDGRKSELRLVAGKLTHRDGQTIENRLYDVLQSGSIDDSRLVQELTGVTDINFIETPLSDALLFLSEQHEIAITLDTTKVADPKQPLTDAFWDIDLCSALTLLTEPRGLACDYRYGTLWITTAEDVRDWRDPTGVAEIEPRAESGLANVWNEPVNLEAINQPLTTAVTQLTKPLAVPIDLSQMAASGTPVDPPVTHWPNRLPFRHVLGALLYKAGCRCELDGDTLVILPPAEPMQRQE